MNNVYKIITTREQLAVYVIVFFLLTIPFLSGCEKEVGSSLKSNAPDFNSISELQERKEKFFAYIQPFIVEKNDEITAKRNKLLALYNAYLNKIPLSVEEKKWLNSLAREYRLDGKKTAPDTLWVLLLRRVDIVPFDLALVQAAKESAWGTSRFARLGHNIYGQQCFKKGCGIMPQDRAEGAVHEVARFDSVRDSVHSYVHNLNTGTAYHDFRTIRFVLRDNGKVPDGYSLIPGLLLYSERRDAYLAELQAMILANRKYLGT
jgi:Bax protein